MRVASVVAVACLSVVGLSGFRVRVAQAESTGPSRDSLTSERGGDKQLAEIVVTAQKRTEKLQDVPISITAIGSEQLRELGATDVKDVLGSVPGLSFSNVQRGQSSYAIRGVSTDVRFASPTVGLYLDDVSLVTQAREGFGAFDAILFDIERVEVLKGPQGTLYGGSAMGGAIKYVSVRPNLTSSSGEITAGVGDIDNGSETYKAQGIFNLPIIPGELAVRGGLYYLREGGYIDNVAGLDIENTAYSSRPYPVYTPLVQPSLSQISENNYNNSDVKVGKLSLLWEPGSAWSIRPSILHQELDTAIPPRFFTNEGELTASYRTPDLKTTDKATLASLEITKGMEGVDVTSLTAHFKRDVFFRNDYSYYIGGAAPFLYPFNSFSSQPISIETFSQELRLSSSPESHTRWLWTAGLYYSSQKDRDRADIFISDNVLGGALFLSASRREVDDYAAFGDVTYHLNDLVDFTAGLRLFKDRIKADEEAGGPLAGGFSHNTAGAKDQGANPKFGVSYKVGSADLLYASASKGFRAGGTVRQFPYAPCAGDLTGLGYNSVPQQFASDHVWTYELGSKNEFDNRLVLNGAVFYTNWSNIQQSIQLPTCGFTFTANAGAARVVGTELEGRFDVTRKLQIGGSFSFTNAKITESAAGSSARDGDELLDTPRWMASAFGTYSIPVTDKWDLKVRTDYQYRSKQRQVFFRDQPVTYADGVVGSVPYGAEFQDGYDVLGMSLTLSTSRTSVRFYGNNLLDKRPLLGRDLTLGASSATTLVPRTLGIEVRYAF